MPNNTLKRQLKVLTIPVFIEMALVMLLSELAERVGLTLANLSILKTGKAKAIRFTTLEAICRELGCQPGDILEYQEIDH
jgi:putative transcriptional regulator